MTRDDIADAACSLLNVPYRHQGRDVRFGLDCGGFVIETMRRLNLDPIDKPNYPESIRGKQLLDKLDCNLKIKDCLEPEIGDIIVFWISNPEVPRHLGILIPDNKFLHVNTGYTRTDKAGKVFYEYLNEKWKKRIYRVYEIKELT